MAEKSGYFYKCKHKNGTYEITKTNPKSDKLNENEFFIFANDKERAFQLALRHIYDGFPITLFKGVVHGVPYEEGVECVI